MSGRTLRALALVAVLAPPAAAQQASATAPRNVVAVNPVGALLGVYAGEYERVLSPTLGASVGGTYWSLLGGQLLSYSSADLRLRYYASGAAPTGLSFGVVAGVTRVATSVAGDQSATAIGTGFEINYGELLGQDRRLYLGVGAGAKRLFPLGQTPDEFRFSYPTWRVAVGWGW